MLMDAPIFHFDAIQKELVAEVAQRAFERCTTVKPVEFWLNDSAYRELMRLEKSGHSKVAYWQNIYRSLNKMSGAEKNKELNSLITEYVQDIVGHFDPTVYRRVTNFVPYLLSFILDPQLTVGQNTLQEKVFIQGEVETINQLKDKGTLILVPTHSSNLDSIVVGWALFRAGLPPFTYGAGKNLFTNRILGYFMRNLGAYRVDRRLKHNLYKDILKMYSLVLLEKGFHSLFFPGGTRSRSGKVEQHLKLGLLGTGIEAYVNNLIHKREKPNIYVVPCTINYFLTLEAETLIDDYLKEVGQSRYIIEDDESAKWSKTYMYIRKTLDLDASLFVHFCPPLDLFGNRVDADGHSYDYHGRQIDASRYVKNWQGEVVSDLERDSEYTRELGQRISESYLANNVILSPHLVSYVVFRYLVFCNPRMDLYQLIRIGFREAHIERRKLVQIIDSFKAFLLEQEGLGILKVGATLRQKTAESILNEALKYLQMFYSREIVVVQEDNLHVQDMKLLYYYHNRLIGYQYERIFPHRFLEPVLGEVVSPV